MRMDTIQISTEDNRAVQNNTLQYRIVQYSTEQYITVQNSTVQYRIVQ